jgi:hypothetical protein
MLGGCSRDALGVSLQLLCRGFTMESSSFILNAIAFLLLAQCPSDLKKWNSLFAPLLPVLGLLAKSSVLHAQSQFIYLSIFVACYHSEPIKSQLLTMCL